MTSKPRRRTARLEKWLHSATTPLFLLSAKRRVLFFNAGCELLTGWTADEVLGQLCEFATEEDHTSVKSVTGGLCPPPEVFDGHERSVPTYFPHRDGRLLARLVQFFPMSVAGSHVESVLGVVTEIEQPAAVVEPSLGRRLHAELAALRISLRQRFGLKSLVCRGVAMTRVLEQISLARLSDTPLLLTGEPGVGKEHVARVIHHESVSRDRAFVPLDCQRLAAWELKHTLNRLFENEPGDSPPAGNLAAATLYLEHVDRLPLDLQARVVEAFSARASRRAGTLRLMASSCIDLERAARDEHARTDLFYLLTTLCIDVPPLRERGDEIPLLAQQMLEQLNRGAEKQLSGFADDVLQQFRQYRWPGNLDELSAVIEQARAACDDAIVRIKDLPFRFRTGLDAQTVGPAVKPKLRPLEPYLAEVEREQIQSALDQCRDNRSKAADLLGITRARLYRRMQALGIEEPESDSNET